MKKYKVGRYTWNDRESYEQHLDLIRTSGYVWKVMLLFIGVSAIIMIIAEVLP